MDKPLPGKPLTPEEDRLVFLGTLSKPQGLKGGVRLWPEFDDQDAFEDLKTDRLVLKFGASKTALRPKPIQFVELTLDQFSIHQRFLVLFFEGITTPEAAETLRDAEVYVYEEDLWDLPEGHFYAYQLAGLPVYDELADGALVGTVVQLRPGVQDYLEIQPPAPEVKPFLIPYVPEIVTKVDLEAQKITARLPEGIAEL